MEFHFDQEKNDLLLKKRGVTFYNVIESIAEKGILLNFDHPNQEKYPGQKILVVNIDGYAYCVPYAIEMDKWSLKTIYPSRKFRFLIGGSNDE